MTDKQNKVYEEIKKYIRKNGYPPTIRELCDILNLKSTGTIQVMLKRIKKKGYIDYNEYKSRTIRIIK